MYLFIGSSFVSVNYREIVPINIEEEMQRSYLDYSMSVIVSRALPDLRDGLKPVHRRIIYAMYEAGYHHNKPHRKSGRIVGDVMGKYHPHGESAIYDSLVRMAQEFSLRLPLVDGQGNFGSIDGDSAAAMRYTESRLSKAAHALIEDLNKNTVEFQPNYDGTEQEPKVLPAAFPNILVNGSGGIAVGMATNIPPHNLGEVLDACCAYIDNNDITIPELMQHIKGPDFPTGGFIAGAGPIRTGYATGRGIITICGKTETEDMDKGRKAIIITEVPYMTNKSKLVERIADLVNDKTIEGISDLRDESDQSGIRVVVELKKDAHDEVIINQLYHHTGLRTSFGINILALDHGIPKLLNLKEIISGFIKFRKEVITKRTIYLLDQARNKAHVLIGLHIALSNIDEVIKLIRAAKDPNIAKEELMSRTWNVNDIGAWISLADNSEIPQTYILTEKQAKVILEMRLQRLTALEKNKILEELQSLLEDIKEYLSILNSEPKLFGIMKDELSLMREFATPRRTQIEESYEGADAEDLIPREDMVVTVTLNGYIKRVPLDTYRTQHRGGKGKSALAMNEEDVITDVFIADTHTEVLFFSTHGQVYSLKLYKLPLGSTQSKGRPIINLLQLKAGEKINNILALPEKTEQDIHIIFATKSGNIRRNDASDFRNIRSTGRIAIKLEEGDELISVKTCSPNDHIMLATYLGKAQRCPVGAVRVFKSRDSDGVRGIKLIEKDRVIAMTILNGIDFDAEVREKYLSIPIDQRIELAKSENNILLDYAGIGLPQEQVLEFARKEQFILSITSNGYGKRSSAYEYRITNRGGGGVINISSSIKIGNVVSVLSVQEDDDIIAITNMGKIIRCKVSSMRSMGRSAGGVILFRTDEGENVVSAAVIADKDQEGDATIINVSNVIVEQGTNTPEE